MRDQDAVVALIDRLAAAIHDKDAAALIGLLTEDAVSYDLAPPLAQ